ncbi:MAG: winged helix-turn-helix transcriptional regulator [Candidatus Thorarchaeota archaeon]|nr:MAG: winged helix-turn-helix transcriptional regulator [Candidatus Thorarchaeota archaeon]
MVTLLAKSAPVDKRMGGTLDRIDKAILREFMFVNCRVSYRSLAKKVGLSPNAAKYRVKKLVDNGTIIKFAVGLTTEMLGADYVICLVFTNGTESSEEFVARLGESHMIWAVLTLSATKGGAYFVFSTCSGPVEQAELGAKLRGYDEVLSIELHRTLPVAHGTKTEFTKSQLRVINCLYDDARMRVEEVARRTGMAAKTVRRILRELEPGRGIRYYCRVNLAGRDVVDAWIRLEWDDKIKTAGEICEWLRDEYPDDLWATWISASDSVMFADFILESLLDVETISSRIREASFVKSTASLVASGQYSFERPTETKIREMLEEAGLRIPTSVT